eukprot:TRINITY_DN50313_c0_g1_i1.p1 TRINITY_DN50313_c0_g1~~TRINITY_DN50313_c0_g1_i1.p1  ORF type:complete len:342 (+),score=62.55 TRINITY_DN50313_c0_g1_i1:2-1027(+)
MRLMNIPGALQQLCCATRSDLPERSPSDHRLAGANGNHVRCLSNSFGKNSTRLRIQYRAQCSDADKFDEAFRQKNVPVFVKLLQSDQAVQNLLEPKHPWAEEPHTVGALSAMQLALLASVVAEEDPAVRELVGSAGAITLLVRFLQSRESDRMQAAVVALRYLTDDCSKNALETFQAGALHPLTELLVHELAGVRGAAAWCLRNVCVESKEGHDQLADLGGIGSLVHHLETLCNSTHKHEDASSKESNDLDQDLLLEAIYVLEDVVVDADGVPVKRYCRLAMQAGVRKVLQNLREVSSGETLEDLNRLLGVLILEVGQDYPDSAKTLHEVGQDSSDSAKLP